MDHIILQIESQEIVIELDAAGAPGLCEAVVRSVPHASLAVHCQLAGAEFCVPVPFFHWHENRRVPVPGDVGYASFGNYLCFYYGEMAADDGPTNIVGRVASNKASFASLGRRLLKQGALRVHLSGASSTGSNQHGWAAAGDSPMAQLSRILLQSTLDDPPEDIMRLRTAALPAMGNIAGRMQASTLLLSLAEVIMNARTLALTSVSPSPIAFGLSKQLARYARLLAIAGMPGTSRWLVAAQDALEADGPDLSSLGHDLEEALVAIARLRFWAESISPWHRVDGDYRDSESAWSSMMSNDGNEGIE